MRPGVSILQPKDIDGFERDGDDLVVHAPTSPITSRGATLNRSSLTIRLSSPIENVIGVSIAHHLGSADQGPVFELADENPSVRIETPGSGDAVFASGALEARIGAEGPWRLDFVADGRVITSSDARSVGAIQTPEGAYVREQLAMGVGETIYGLGERFGTFAKNGQSVDIWNEDGGTASEQAYKNVPFYLSDAGYGLFVDHPGAVSFEIGSEAVSRAQFSVPGQELTYYVVYGATPKDILERYTALTGRPAEVPAWTYGLWLSTSFTTNYDEATVMSFIDGMAEREIPLSVFHFDCFWMRAFHWSDFVWDPAMFPDPQGMLARIKAKGLRVSAWINPYIAQRSHLFEEGRKLGYLVRRADGSVWQWDMWQAGMALVDFTNPDAVRWFQDKLRALLGDGVDAFKTDFGERVPTDVVWHDGSDPKRMHNYYTQLYNKAVFELLESERGEGEAVLFARSATAGGQHFPVHWGGDCESTFVSMAESLRGGLSLGMSGFGYWSHDIGGFEGTPDPAVFKRWVAFGLLSSHSRLHGSDSYRVPWAFDDEAVDVTRQFTRLKMSLMPYLARAAREATLRGTPIMRAMALEFPGDRAVSGLGTQYMLGESILVAPVFSAEGDVDVYLPEGQWTQLLTGETVTGGSWRREKHGFDSLPIYVREGSVVPFGAETGGPEYAWADGVTVKLYALPDGYDQTIEVPGGTGAATEFRVRRQGSEISVTAGAGAGSWNVDTGGTAHTHSGPGTLTVALADGGSSSGSD
ncbi:alpha-xylosidase [Microbacterium sorbitolivorans]|nr:alpha-xylosidase [Microbacterium sorbitolivorans]